MGGFSNPFPSPLGGCKCIVVIRSSVVFSVVDDRFEMCDGEAFVVDLVEKVFCDNVGSIFLHFTVSKFNIVDESVEHRIVVVGSHGLAIRPDRSVYHLGLMEPVSMWEHEFHVYHAVIRRLLVDGMTNGVNWIFVFGNDPWGFIFVFVFLKSILDDVGVSGWRIDGRSPVCCDQSVEDFPFILLCLTFELAGR